VVLDKFGSFVHTSSDVAAKGLGGRFLGGKPMLLPYSEPMISREDQQIFDALVPFDHWTRRADKHIDFLGLRKTLEPAQEKDILLFSRTAAETSRKVECMSLFSSLSS